MYHKNDCSQGAQTREVPRVLRKKYLSVSLVRGCLFRHGGRGVKQGFDVLPPAHRSKLPTADSVGTALMMVPGTGLAAKHRAKVHAVC
jgi:hypothetical protein